MLEFFFGKSEPKDNSLDQFREQFRKVVREEPRDPKKIADLMCTLNPNDWPKAMPPSGGLEMPSVRLRADGSMDFTAYRFTINSQYCNNRKK